MNFFANWIIQKTGFESTCCNLRFIFRHVNVNAGSNPLTRFLISITENKNVSAHTKECELHWPVAEESDANSAFDIIEFAKWFTLLYNTSKFQPRRTYYIL
jgi:hypothetical protein